ncbi:MAG TPA: 6-pyruvoyl-tetrahydropterin synthase-related protein [Patescibacteria group bacterium]|nr:6-pyruvoyl-tetrahydropterin synthase-related protein [Patescibacteria group bacterium]
MKFLKKYIFGILFFVSCAGVILVTCGWLFNSGFYRPHDYTHAARIAEMARSLSDGEFPVRWSQNFGFGYGMPLFNFYAPLPYYLGAVFYLLGVTPIISIKLLLLIATVIGFTAMFWLAKELWGKYGGLVSAIFFSLATYRALDMYVRADIGEIFAMSLLPLLFLGVIKVWGKKPSGWLLVTATLFGVLLSHNLTGMLSVGFVALFVVFLICAEVFRKKKVRIRKTLVIISAGVFGILLSAFYVLPAFFEKQFTRVDQTIISGYFDFHNHFVALRQFLFGTWGYGGSQPGLSDGISFALGLSLLAIVLIGFIALLLYGSKTQKMFGLGITVLAFLSLFLTTDKSVFIWEHIQLFKYLQFPWRFLLFSHIFLSLLAGSSVLLINKFKWSGIVIVLLIGWSIYTGTKIFVPEKLLYGSDLDQYYSVSPDFIRQNLSRFLNDYIPPAVIGDHFPKVAALRLVPTDATTQVQIVSNQSSYVSAKLSGPEASKILINVFQFPGWKAKIDGFEVPLEKSFGFPVYEVTVPEGNHLLEVKMENSLIRTLGNGISAVSLLVFLLLVISRSRKSRV